MASTRIARQPAAASGFDPLRTAWRLLTNVKFAMVLVATAAAVGMIGVVIPQLPAEMQGNPAAQSAWYALQREDYGPFTDPMRRLDLFNVYRAWWFYALWGVIIASVTVCTVSRIRPTVRSIHRPPKDVADGYFESAQHRADFELAGGAEKLEEALRKRRYHVERVREGGGEVRLFAERFGWSQYGTFVSHLALIMVLVGGLLTVMGGFHRTLALAETGGAAPLFDTPGPNQIFVGMDDAIRRLDAEGHIVDFRSLLTLRRGDDVVHCVTTVNDPCQAFGYRFHQAAFFNDLARVEIEGPDGRLLYSDVLDFNGKAAPAPLVKVTDAGGAVLLEQALPQLGSDGDLALSRLIFPGVAGGGAAESVQLPIAWSLAAGRMTLYVSDGVSPPQPIDPGGQTVLFAGSEFAYTVAFEDIAGIPTIELADLPGAGTGGAVVEMPTDPDGQSFLVIDGVDSEPLLLGPGDEAKTASGYTYRFQGRLDGAGIDVKRDPGDTFIFVAVVLALIGLAMTFYVPRRRLWARVRGGRAQLAGIAGRSTRFGRELRRIGADLGADDAMLPSDVEERW